MSQNAEIRRSNFIIKMFESIGDVGAPIDRHRSLVPFGIQKRIRQSASISTPSRFEFILIRNALKSRAFSDRKKSLKSIFKRTFPCVWGVALSTIERPLRYAFAAVCISNFAENMLHYPILQYLHFPGRLGDRPKLTGHFLRYLEYLIPPRCRADQRHQLISWEKSCNAEHVEEIRHGICPSRMAL